MIAGKLLDKRRQSLLDLAIFGDTQRSHRLASNSIIYSYYKEPEEQTKQHFIWYPKDVRTFSEIHEENDVLKDKELPLAKNKLKEKNACLFIHVESPQSWVIINGRSNEEKP